MPSPAPAYPAAHNLLEGRIVLVTAAAGTGIGFSTAKRAAEEGATVVVNDVKQETAQKTVGELGGPGIAIQADVSDSAQVRAMFERWTGDRSDACGAKDPHTATHAVGSHPTGASPSGALDMAGNVLEWTKDHEGPFVVARGGREIGSEDQLKTTYRKLVSQASGPPRSPVVATLARTGQFFPGCSVPIIPDSSWQTITLMVLTMTAGTVFVMWLGERITERGVGNGMSLLIFTSIAAAFPQNISAIWRSSNGPMNTLLLALLLFVVIAVVVFVEQSQRRIPVQYAKRVVGRRTLGGSSTYIPLKINMAGVIPVIFASSLLTLPQVISQFSGQDPADWVVWMNNNIANTKSPWHMLLYILLIIFFAYFYTAITFNPDQVADDMKKYGGFIPGIRPGKPTADFLEYVLSRITAAGSLYLALVALAPMLAFVLMGVSTNIPFGGTSILILVGVGLDTVKRIQSQLEQRHYEGFLK